MTADKFYQVDSPQEFDKAGNELGPDAQVWKTYVKETEARDAEQVDGWNRFVIESYKSFKQDPVDVSNQALFVISQALTVIAGGSQTLDATSKPADLPTFSASRSAICVNVLWFLSLSLSVAVSLIFMLAKEWCLTFMSGRTGPPGVQARRRQQRWDGLIGWKMEEVLMVLPSLIHLSLLLFAIGLCVFLWDVHFGVAVPVLFVTFIGVAAYISCTILPFIDKYCPYGTVISMLVKQLTDSQSQQNRFDWLQDVLTAKAIHWMIEHCETPRSVDIALQSIAGATKDLPWDLLARSGIWSMIKQRLDTKDLSKKVEDPSKEIYVRALERILIMRRRIDRLDYGSNPATKSLEVVMLGFQTCVDDIRRRIKKDESSAYRKIEGIVPQCTHLGIHFIKSHGITPEIHEFEKVEELNANSTVVPDHPEQLALSATDYTLHEKAVSLIWQSLIAVTYSGVRNPDYGTESYGLYNLLLDHRKYGLTATDCAKIMGYHSGEYHRGSAYNSSLDVSNKDLHSQLSTLLSFHLTSNAFIPHEFASLVASASNYYNAFSRYPGNRRFIPTPVIYVSAVNGLCQANSIEEKNNWYQALNSWYFPKISVGLVQQLSSDGVFVQLYKALNDNDPLLRGFATAQIWLIRSLIQSEVGLNGDHAASEILPAHQLNLLESDTLHQETSTEQLEESLKSLLASDTPFETENNDDTLNWRTSLFMIYRYLSRILECMLTKRDEPLSEFVKYWLLYVPNDLRGLASSVYLAGEGQTEWEEQEEQGERLSNQP
ncbi:hypothetical protein RhiTH_010332 [Rhizoctonia solani]